MRRTWFEEQPYFFRLCLRWTSGNTHDAEDIMGQVCVKVLEAPDAATESIRNPRAWIARVMHNLCVDGGRANERSRMLSETELTAPRPAPSPDLGVARLELVDALAEAVRQLPGHLREVVILRLVEEQSYEDICGTLDISLPNARKRLQQARALLRPNLEPYWFERLDRAVAH
ncbi:RNA polymerase sigma factor [Nannocystaceae bacterium ST9]